MHIYMCVYMVRVLGVGVSVCVFVLKFYFRNIFVNCHNMGSKHHDLGIVFRFSNYDTRLPLVRQNISSQIC